MTHFSEHIPSHGDLLLYIIKIVATEIFLLFNLCYVLHKCSLQVDRVKLSYLCSYWHVGVTLKGGAFKGT